MANYPSCAEREEDFVTLQELRIERIGEFFRRVRAPEPELDLFPTREEFDDGPQGPRLPYEGPKFKF